MNLQHLDLNLAVFTQWIDDRLKIDWFDQNRRPLLTPDELKCFWRPFLYMRRIHDGRKYRDDVLPEDLILQVIENHVHLRLNMKFILQVICKMNFRSFPFDIQTCKLEFTNLPIFDYSFRWGPGSRFKQSVYTVSQFEVGHPVNSSRICPFELQTCLVLTFTLVRKVTPSIISIFAPSSIIVYMSVASFWIDPLAVPGRVTLIVTSLLALITQLLSLKQSSAPVSYVTALDIWFLTCITFVSLSLFEFAISYTMALKLASNDKRPSHEPTRGRNPVKKLDQSIDRFSQMFFPTSFILFKLIYFISFSLINYV